jgi:hypothetical protein
MGCECQNSGWCPRHRINKTEHLHNLCKTDEEYFDIWETGMGPLQDSLTEEERESITDKTKKESITACNCNFSMNYDIDTGKGFCDRHKCWKNDEEKKRCQIDKDLFILWEMGEGPGQEGLSDEHIDELKERIKQEQPGILKKMWNFGKALKNHVSDGIRTVSNEVYEKRLSECDNCVYREENRCLHSSCGCTLTHKAKWNSEKCPIGRWQNDDQFADQ